MSWMRKYELDEELTTLKEASNLVKAAQIAAMWKSLEAKKMHSIYDRTARRGRGTLGGAPTSGWWKVYSERSLNAIC